MMCVIMYVHRHVMCMYIYYIYIRISDVPVQCNWPVGIYALYRCVRSSSREMHVRINCQCVCAMRMMCVSFVFALPVDQGLHICMLFPPQPVIQ